MSVFVGMIVVMFLDVAPIVVSLVSACIAGVALWRSWRWQPREARFELVAQRGSSLDREHVSVYVVNVGDVPARGVRYEVERATLKGTQVPARNAEIIPGAAGDTMVVSRESDRWEGAAVIVTWYPFPVHRGRRERRRLSLAEAIADSPPRFEVPLQIF